MEREEILLEVPESILEEYDIKDVQKVELVVTERGLLYLFNSSLKQPVVPLLNILFSAIISAIVMWLVYRQYTQIPLSGINSMATIVIIVSTITASINFTYFFTKNKRNVTANTSNKLYWRNYPVVLLAFILILIVLLTFGFWLVGQFFLNASFDIYTATIGGSVVVAIVNYIMIYIALSLRPQIIIRSLIVVILLGVAIAMITNQEHQWWLYNFSFLGTPEATRGWQFNLTLIFSSLLMVALIDYLFVLLADTIGKRKRLTVLKVLLLAIAVCLGGVGVFPYNEIPFYQIMHNRVAELLVYLFIILIISIKWLLPNVSKQFLKISYFLGGLLVLSIFLFSGVNYLSLTVFELFAFVIALSWLLLLLQHLIYIVDTHNKVFVVKTVQKSSNESK